MIGSLLGLIGGATGISLIDSGLKFRAQRETNATNMQIAREANAANVQQAELAYQRSLPTEQVKQMMNAGMSKAGALSALQGGGSYSAPTMNTAQVGPENFDLSAIADRLANIPAVVSQQEMVREQINSLRQDAIIKEHEESRKQELHEYQIWKEKYGQDSAIMLDSVKSSILNAADAKGIDITKYDNLPKLMRALGLENDSTYKSLPFLAHSDLLQMVRDQNAENRANVQSRDQHRAAIDAHDLAELEKVIKGIDVKYYDREKHESLLNLMRVGQGLIQDNNIKFQDYTAKEMENFVRSAGIENEAQARAIAEYVNKLAQDDELDIQLKRNTANKNTLGVHNQLRVLLRDLGEILMKVKM